MGIGNLLIKLVGVKCPGCNYQLRVEDFKTAQLRNELQCPQCHQVIDTSSPSVPAKIDKTNAVATPQVKVSERGEEIKVEIKWLSKSSGFVISFAAIWNAILLFVVFTVLFVKGGRIHNESFAYLLFGMLGLIGLWLAYSAICEIFNTTTILLKSDKMTFWTKPFPMEAGRTVNVADIRNLSLERVEEGRQNNRRIFKHYINILLKDGSRVHLCRVQDMNEGIFIEKLLEDRLGLKDEPKLDRIAF